MPLNPYTRQCNATSKRTRERCRNPAVTGYRVCRMHGARGGAPLGNLNALRHGNTTSTMKELRHCRKERRKSLRTTLSILAEARKLDERLQKALGSSHRKACRLLRNVGHLAGVYERFLCLEREYRANRERSQALDRRIAELTEKQAKVWGKLGICISTPCKGNGVAVNSDSTPRRISTVYRVRRQ